MSRSITLRGAPTAYDAALSRLLSSPEALTVQGDGGEVVELVGEDGEEVGYAVVGNDGNLEVIEGDDFEVGYEVAGGRVRPRVVRRPAPVAAARRITVPTRQLIKPGVIRIPPVRSAPARVGQPYVRDQFDMVYASAMNEAGTSIPETAIFSLEGDFANAAAFSISASAPQSFVLTGLIFNDGAANGGLRSVTFTVGGQPVGGLTRFTLSRFRADSRNGRLPPIEVPAGTPIVLAGTASVASGTVYLAADILGIPMAAGLTMATR